MYNIVNNKNYPNIIVSFDKKNVQKFLLKNVLEVYF